MAVTFTCDGCGKPVDSPTGVGYTLARDYCPSCATKAQAFLDAEEAMRKVLVGEFFAERKVLIERHAKDGFKLPDVP